MRWWPRGSAMWSWPRATSIRPPRSTSTTPWATPPRGVHIATLGGLWQAAVLGFGGLWPTADRAPLRPACRQAWQALSFRVQWRTREVEIRLERATRLLTATLHSGDPMRIYIGDQAHTMAVHG